MLLVGQVSAMAQGNRSSRPYRALFGGSAANPDVHHTFDFTTSVFAGYDENIADGSNGGSLSPLLQSGGYLGVSGALEYDWETRRVQIGANVATNTRYYRDVSDFVGTTHTASIGVAAQMGQRGRVYVNQSVSHAPSYLYSLTPGWGSSVPGTVVGGGSFPLGDRAVYVFDTSANTTFSVSRRGSIEALANYRYSDLGATGARIVDTLRSYAVGGRFRHGFSRYGSLRLGYVYRQGQYGYVRTNAATTVHDIDVGVDYARPLSLTRRTTLDFSTGSSIVSMPALDLPTDDSGDSAFQVRVVGNVGLTHEMGRTWKFRLGYNRGVGFAEAFAQPVFNDAFNLSLDGFFSRKLDFSASGGFSSGEVGPDAGGSVRTSNSSFRTWHVSARSRYALGSMWALYALVGNYSQDLGSAVIVPTGVPSVFDRRTVQGGLTFWLPLLRR
jgi:hypothetical protein